MIWAQWYFSDEAEQEVGPFLSEGDAKEAEGLYGDWLNCRDCTGTELCPAHQSQSVRFKQLIVMPMPFNTL